MRSPPLVILVSLVCLLAGCGATQVQRRNNAMLTAAAGATLLAVGLMVAASEDDDDCADQGPSFCLDLVNENKVGGGLLAVTGGVLVFGGLGAFMVSTLPPPQQNGPDLTIPVGDPAECADWQRRLDAETDPARRGALHAVRPAHCAWP